MISKLKWLSLLFVIVITFVGCSNYESESIKVSEDFIKYLYTVDSEKISQYNDFSTTMSEKVESQLNNTTTSGIIMIDDKSIPVFDRPIQPMMTDEAYNRFKQNRSFTSYIIACKEKNVTMEVEDLVLTRAYFNREENKIGFNYEVKLIIKSDTSTDIKPDNGFGSIDLIKEKDQWKVYSLKYPGIPKFIVSKK
jgi:hypothetical protein